MSLRLFWATLQLMTRIPLPASWTQGLAMDNYQRGIVGFPLIGLIVGAIGGAVFTLLAPWCGAAGGIGLRAGVGFGYRGLPPRRIGRYL